MIAIAPDLFEPSIPQFHFASAVARVLRLAPLGLFALGTLMADPGPKGGNIIGPANTRPDAWQAFLDDGNIAMRQGIRTVAHPAERYAGNPLMFADVGTPWETKGSSDHSITYDPKTGWFHMRYTARASVPGTQEGAIGNNAYARSRDGVHWERPTLGLVEFAGVGKKNNLIPASGKYKLERLELNPAPPVPSENAMDPNPPTPDRRFVKIVEENLPSGGWSKYAAVSADGYSWTKLETPLGDLRKTALTTPPTSTPRYIYLCQNWVRESDLGRRFRGVYRMESEDLIHWTGATWAFSSHAASYNPDWEDYGINVPLVASNRYRGLLVGFYTVFRTDPNGPKLAHGIRFAGPLEAGLSVSRDTIHWSRIGFPQPFLPVGKPGAWDDGMVMVAGANVIELNDRLMIYYEGFDGPHEEHKTFRSGLGLATLRRDGFVSLQAEYGEGSVTTKPLKISGKKLEVNADAAGGRIQIEVLDEAGKPIQGFSASDCTAVKGTGVEQSVTWKSEPGLGSLRGRNAALRFVLTGDAHLYAYRITD